MPTNFNDLMEAGIEALDNGEPQKALSLLERAKKLEETPTLNSCLAYCLARERGQINTGLRLCEDLIHTDPDNPFHHLNLGRILLLDGKRREAIAGFRQGIKSHPHPQIIRELELLGIRKTRILSFLNRGNLLNKLLGRLLK